MLDQATARPSISPRERDLRRRLRDEFPYYARKCLFIRTKAGDVRPFVLNRSQLHLHDRLEKQRRERGYVRALVLKGRQVGISTYINGRFYWRLSHKRGFRAFILTHLDIASENLFQMAKRFHEHTPDLVKPVTGKSNAKELYFAKLDSGYKVATAGSAEVGRSETIQMFHGSEVGFWPNAMQHTAGIRQAIAQARDTEVVFESTANGIGNAFHSEWKAAERGDSDYEPIFIPWYWHEEYAETPPTSWRAPVAWQEYAEVYGLDGSQIYWAWKKNREMVAVSGGNPSEPGWQFKQEYPGNADEAFQSSGEDSFIPPMRVMQARKNIVQPYGPLILGVDPARGGGDKTAIIDRQGRRLGGVICQLIDVDDLMAIAGGIVKIVPQLQRLNLKKIIIDTTGLGAGLYDRLREQLGDLVMPVNFSQRAWDTDKYVNRRAEMWDQMRIWFEDPAGVQVPDRDDVQGDLTSIIRGKGATGFNSNAQLVLESKEHVKERGLPSPDFGDAAALTFAVDMSLLLDDNSNDEADDFMASHTRSDVTGY